nr:hypothetical protein [Tanacetum cinerariifolium]
MAESSNLTQIPSPPELIPKEEPGTQPHNRPKSLNPLLALEVEFNLDEITFNTNNEVAILYPSHPQSEYFKVVLDFISKCCLKEAFTRAPNQYIEYLPEFWYTIKALEDSKIWVSTPTGGIRGKVSVNTFRNAFRANHLSHSKVLVEFKALKTSSTSVKVSQGKRPGAKCGLKRKQTLKHRSESKTEANKGGVTPPKSNINGKIIGGATSRHKVQVIRKRFLKRCF